MKRKVTIVISCIFLLYGMVLLSSINFGKINYPSFLKNTLRQSRIFLGIGALFTREVSLDNYRTLYRFYQNGQWQGWQELEKQSFEAYVNDGNVAALKHTRLDMHLSQKLYFNGYKPQPKNFKNTVDYQVFIQHLIFRHSATKPDSIAVSYQKEDRQSKKFRELIQFKCRP